MWNVNVLFILDNAPAVTLYYFGSTHCILVKLYKDMYRYVLCIFYVKVYATKAARAMFTITCNSCFEKNPLHQMISVDIYQYTVTIASVCPYLSR